MGKNKKMIVVISILAVVCFAFIGIIVWNTFKDDDSNNAVAVYESKQLKGFTTAMQKDFEKAKGMEYEVARDYLNTSINTNRQLYPSSAVDAASYNMLSAIMSGDFSFLNNKTSGNSSADKTPNGNGSNNNNPSGNGSVNTPSFPDVVTNTSDLTSALDSMVSDLNVDSLIGNIIDGFTKNKTISLRSNTACQSVTDQKYCVNLSGNVYITDVNSKNWVVLVHPFMTSGSLIYNSIGGMYQDQGYNVIAPDLRGFGNSGGSVAMGYLESLDIYDWIKDLNSNWNDSSRYGVSVAPENIIVHGISLGGATTLQLATNPDIAAAKGIEPYTKNLTQLNVNGFVDDCGYTSMSGIITGMLGGSVDIDALQLTRLFDSLGIKEVDFMSKMIELFDKYNVEGFESLDVKNLISGSSNPTDIINKINTIKKFSEQYTYLDSFLGGFSNSTLPNNNSSNKNNPYFNGKFNMDKFDIDSIIKNYGGSYSVPEKDDYKEYSDKILNMFGNLVQQNNSTSSMQASPIANNLLGNSDNFLDGIIGTALMDLVGVGLTEENYAKYSDVFSNGRKFPSGAKVVVIHGTADTTVPHSNADTVAANVAPAKLIKKWDVSGAPHAFVIIGSKTNEYSNLVANITDCVESTTCSTVK